jgi:hypothetical protein
MNNIGHFQNPSEEHFNTHFEMLAADMIYAKLVAYQERTHK